MGLLEGIPGPNSFSYSAGVPRLDSVASPFEWAPMVVEQHFRAVPPSGDWEATDLFYLASPAMLPQLHRWAAFVSDFVAYAHRLAPVIPASAFRPDLIRVVEVGRVPSPEERSEISLFEAAPRTPAGKPAKFPVRLMLVAGRSRSDLYFLKDGTLGKARIVVWAAGAGFTIEAKLLDAELRVAYVNRISNGERERIYDYRSAP